MFLEWCVAVKGLPLKSIRATLRGNVYRGLFDRDRPDVLDHLQMPTAPRLCGFSVIVRVPAGKSVLELKVARADKQWHSVFTHTVHGPRFMTQRQEDRERAIANARADYDFWFDHPRDWTQPTSTLYVSGWCVALSGEWIDGIRARLGHQIFEGRFGISRPDVAVFFPHLAPAPVSGFAVTVQPPAGRSTLILELKKTDGSWRSFFTRDIWGDPRAAASKMLTATDAADSQPDDQPPGFKLWFDRPTNWDDLGADIHISGWCVATRGDSISEMRARVGSKIFPLIYGLPRPATALALEEYPNALRSGFAGEPTPRGSSTFVLETRIQMVHGENFLVAESGGLGFREKRPNGAVGNYSEWIRAP